MCLEKSNFFFFRLLQFKYSSHDYSRAQNKSHKEKKRQRWSEGGDTSLRLPVVPQGALSFSSSISGAAFDRRFLGRILPQKRPLTAATISVGSTAVGYYICNRDKF